MEAVTKAGNAFLRFSKVTPEPLLGIPDKCARASLTDNPAETMEAATMASNAFS